MFTVDLAPIVVQPVVESQFSMVLKFLPMLFWRLLGSVLVSECCGVWRCWHGVGMAVGDAGVGVGVAAWCRVGVGVVGCWGCELMWVRSWRCSRYRSGIGVGDGRGRR